MPAAGLTDIRRRSIDSGDADEVEQALGTLFEGNRPRFQVARAGSRFVAHTASDGVLSVTRGRSTLIYDVDAAPTESLLAFVVDREHTRVTSASGETRLGPGDAMSYPAGVAQRIDHPGAREMGITTVALPMTRLEEAAREATDIGAGTFRWIGGAPVSASAGRYWRSVVSLASGALLDDQSPAASSPLVREQLTHLVALAAVTSFPNSSLAAASTVATTEAAAAPATIRRAVEHMEAHAHLPLTIGQIAQAAGVTPRALQQGFRRHHDLTPLGYLRRVRLMRVHEELRSSDPRTGATVGAVAMRWGLVPNSRFATDYRDAYGCSPSTTLRT